MKTKSEDGSIVCNDLIYERWSDSNGSVFYIKSPSQPIIACPVARWNGPKMKYSMWATMCALFERVSDEEESEAQVQLWCRDRTESDPGELIPWAFPQKRKTGLTTVEIPDHPEYIKKISELRSRGFYNYGTVHTHNRISAGQSSVDSEDEKRSEGLHITLGKINKNLPYDVHARFNGKIISHDLDSNGNPIGAVFCMTDVKWTDFIDTPEWVDIKMANTVQLSVLNHVLETIFLRPDISMADTALVDEWMKNRIAVNIPKPQSTRNNGNVADNEWWYRNVHAATSFAQSDYMLPGFEHAYVDRRSRPKTQKADQHPSRAEFNHKSAVANLKTRISNNKSLLTRMSESEIILLLEVLLDAGNSLACELPGSGLTASVCNFAQYMYGYDDYVFEVDGDHVAIYEEILDEILEQLDSEAVNESSPFAGLLLEDLVDLMYDIECVFLALDENDIDVIHESGGVHRYSQRIIDFVMEHLSHANGERKRVKKPRQRKQKEVKK